MNLLLSSHYLQALQRPITTRLVDTKYVEISYEEGAVSKMKDRDGNRICQDVNQLKLTEQLIKISFFLMAGEPF